jgi:hypothetical protein
MPLAIPNGYAIDLAGGAVHVESWHRFRTRVDSADGWSEMWTGVPRDKWETGETTGRPQASKGATSVVQVVVRLGLPMTVSTSAWYATSFETHCAQHNSKIDVRMDRISPRPQNLSWKQTAKMVPT